MRAVDGVSLTVAAAQTVALVGESGSGKSSIARAVLGLTPTAGGSILFQDTDITHFTNRQRRTLHASMQAVFQDPYASLNPARTIGKSLVETLRPQRVDSDVARSRATAMLERVGLPRSAIDRYPAQFSGGQRQRIAIARALMTQARLVICDEPVSALDLSVQAQILNILRDLQDTLGVSYLFISHDLPVVRHIAHRTVVLYRGQVMEAGPTRAVHDSPAHPYTRLLLDSVPAPDGARRRSVSAARLSAQPSGAPAARPSTGCPFAGRCLYAVSVCAVERPAIEITPDGAAVACHRWRELPGRTPTRVGEPLGTVTGPYPAGQPPISAVGSHTVVDEPPSPSSS
ncbi:ABC transporter ATP-binding protein [Dactylosporangium sp. NPDC051484]|uniref:ABC transporter ATP-binding protein n=1 Tax=Dactylosporangium sp. NPDC051484 TaxID=3154942 RepID=UPI00344B9B70